MFREAGSAIYAGVGGRTAASMWRIVAAAALLGIGIRGVLTPDVRPDTALCVAEILLTAALGIDQPFKWWAALAGVLVYYVAPAVLAEVLRSKRPQASRFAEWAGPRARVVLQQAVFQIVAAGTALGVLANEVHRRDEGKPWMSLAFAIWVTTQLLAPTFNRQNWIAVTTAVEAARKKLANRNSKSGVHQNEPIAAMGVRPTTWASSRLRF